MSSQAIEKLLLVYDPLCGWCYGATPGIRRLQDTTPLELVPSGLFAGAGARPLDEHFAQHAWSSDQRIAQLTGQPFSSRYREKVLANRSARLDSGPATVALTAAHQVDPRQELPVLEAIQKARYVDGLDVTDERVLAAILRALHLEAAAERLETAPAELREAAAARMLEGQRLLRSVGANGVPTLIAREGAQLRLIPSDPLFTRKENAR